MNRGFAYSHLISDDDFSIFLHVVIIVAAALAILGSLDYLDREGIQRGEYYALVLFAAAGMGILASANELVTAFVGLEMSSISTYVLVGFRRRALDFQRSSAQIFPARLVRHRVLSLRHRHGLRRHGHNHHRQNSAGSRRRFLCGRFARPGHPRPRPDVRRPGFQSRYRAIPNLRPGRVRRRPVAGYRAFGFGPKGCGIRAHAAHFRGFLRLCIGHFGSGPSGFPPFSPCSSAILRRSFRPT